MIVVIKKMNNFNKFENLKIVKYTKKKTQEFKLQNSILRTIFWVCFVLLIMIIPVILGEIYFLNLNFSFIKLSIFGIFSSFHFFFQIFISWLYWRKGIKKVRSVKLSDEELPSIGVQISGWREDPILFKKCLISIKRQTYKNIKYITFCSDGNEDDDLYMGKIFKEIYPDGECIILNKVCKNMTDDERATLFEHCKKYKNVCFLQPHGGKRYAMYTQMKNLIYNECDYILFIDSDTIVEKEAVKKLVKNVKYYNSDAVTGDVRIWNPDNLLGYLIALKYWFAFNLERSGQSYFGSVSCIAGPFGLYKKSFLNKISEEWNRQSFLGKECTFGDDRHLTNLVLKYGGITTYEGDAICYTDTPTTLSRFISQQVRWGKSFVREYLLNLTWFNLKNLWLVFDLSFQILYSFIILVILVQYFLTYDILTYLYLALSIIIVSYLRVIYSIIVTKEKYYIVFGLYGFVFFNFLLPLKYWSTFTVNITNWGTGNRLTKTFKNNDIIPVILWNCYIIYCLIRSILNIEKFTNEMIILTTIIGLNLLFLYLCYILFRGEYKKKIEKIIEDITGDIKNENKDDVIIEIDEV